MAIKFGMSVADMILQLTKGFIKATGRKPEALEKIKIQQEAVQRFRDQRKVVDMEGNILDTSKPIMGGTQESAALKSGIMKATGAKPKSVKTSMKKMIDDAIEDASPGFANDIKYDAEIVAENLAERMGLVYDDLPTKQRLDLYDQAYTGLSKKRFKNKPEPEDFAIGGRVGLKDGISLESILEGKIPSVKMPDPLQKILEKMTPEEKEMFKMRMEIMRRGFEINNPANPDAVKPVPMPTYPKENKADGGRIGLKDGMDRRGFLKLMGGLAALPVLGKFFKVGKVASKAAPAITTPPLPNKPEWFDSLVNKVITMGEDVTKKFAFKERQTVHKLDIDEFEDVMVYRDPDAGEIRVTYESPNNAGESSIDLVYKKELPDEGNPNPSPEFYAVEPEPRVVNRDGDMEFDGENLVDNVDELMSDTTKLKEIATGKKRTLGEFVKSKKKKDEVKEFNENALEQAEYLESKYGPGPEPDFDDIENFASGGIARMLGE